MSGLSQPLPATFLLTVPHASGRFPYETDECVGRSASTHTVLTDPQEDKALADLVAELGCRNWKAISEVGCCISSGARFFAPSPISSCLSPSPGCAGYGRAGLP